MMNMKEFQQYLADNIKEYLPQSYEDAKIQFQEVLKNGDQKLIGMTVSRSGENIVPTMYINADYEEYLNGKDIDQIVGNLADLRVEHEDTLGFGNLSQNLLNYEQMKDKLQIRVCDSKENVERLKGLVHTERSDYSATYHVLLSSQPEGQSSVAVTPQLLESWGVTKEQLHQDALASDLTRGPVFVNMGDMMENMMYGKELTNLLDHPDAAPGIEGMNMYCLTNDDKMNAAGLIMQDNIMARIADVVGGNYFVLPSSVHELLVIPESSGMSVQELSFMVHDVNETQVSLQDKLSDQVQHYDKDSGLLENAEKREARLEMEKPGMISAKENRGSIHDRLQEKKQQSKESKAEKTVEKAAKRNQQFSL